MNYKTSLLLGIGLSASLLSRAQHIQGTLRPGSGPNKIDLIVKPDFSNTTDYVYQFQFPVAFPATATPQPTTLNVTLDPAWSTQGYSVSVYPKSGNTAGTENYFVISLVRSGSAAQSWTSGNEYRILTAAFIGPANPPTSQVKLADYSDGGKDGQGNFYVATGTGSYNRYDNNSVANFYGVPGMSTPGGNTANGFVQLNSSMPLPVKLNNFHASALEKKVKLEWSVIAGQDVAYYEVRRSTDGRLFDKTICRQIPSEQQAASYLQYDTSPEAGMNYYQLAIADKNGSTSTSPVQQVRMADSRNFTLMPNPATTQLTLHGIEETDDYRITSPLGQVITGKRQNQMVDIS